MLTRPGCLNCLPVALLLQLQPFIAACLQQQQQQGVDRSSSSSHNLPLLAFDDALLRHTPPVGSSHPERPDRTAAIVARLHATGLVARCRKVSARVCVWGVGGLMVLQGACLAFLGACVLGSRLLSPLLQLRAASVPSL